RMEWILFSLTMKRVRAWTRRLRALDVQIHDDGLLPAADDHSFDGLIRRRVHFLMGNVRRHVDEIPRAGFFDVFQAITPAKPGAPTDDVENRFELAMMVRARSRRGLYDHGARPQLAGAGLRVSNRGRARHPG